MNILNNDWANYLNEEFEKPYYQELRDFLKREYSTTTVYPNMGDIYNALHYTPYKDVKVVIIGQDPYHGPNQAHGLCFSVQPSVQAPPSLINIYKEIQADLGCHIPNNGYLKKWADQGVLMLNTVLTVRAHQAHSHKDKGWEYLTDKIIYKLNKREDPIVFLLWGRPAGIKQSFITNPNHLVLKAAHPSPLSAYKGFFGCKHFSKTNDYLLSKGSSSIDWQIENI